MKQKIYNNLDEWYFSEISYKEMLNNFRYTKDPLTEAIGHKRPITFNDNPYPLDHATLMFHAKAFAYDSKTKREGYSNQELFQFYNKEFNDGLVKILKKIKPKLILDVGAGDGMLSKILSDRGFNVIATDDYSWPFKKRCFKIKKMTYQEALKKYRPDVVISTWMPYQTDWTPYFRKIKSVKYYITIGEVNQCCGGNWDDRKGWKVECQNKASNYALCRTDDLFWNKNNCIDEHFMMHHSYVYLFSREEKL